MGRFCGLIKQEGHKPCQIISPQLNVGGPIKRNASNGNTKVFVNSREITKLEYWTMNVSFLNTLNLLNLKLFNLHASHECLQLAGIRCVENLSLWLSADGSIQEEGQKKVMDPIGNKVCLLVYID